jgi:hypothetical protein
MKEYGIVQSVKGMEKELHLLGESLRYLLMLRRAAFFN